jgi:hypothetical protein
MLRCTEPNFAELMAIRLVMTSDRVSANELSEIAEAARARVIEARRFPAPPPPSRPDRRKPH